MAKNDFQYGEWNFYTLQCGMWLWKPIIGPLKSKMTEIRHLGS